VQNQHDLPPAIETPSGEAPCVEARQQKRVALSLVACDFCHEATADGSNCCDICAIIYGPIFDKFHYQHRIFSNFRK
jgi:hypothetical protein